MQALQHGVPVIAVPSNLDQYLNMHYLAAAGVGRIVRTGPSAGSAVRAALGEMLSDRAWSARAQQVAEKLAAHDYRRTFPGILAAAGKR